MLHTVLTDDWGLRYPIIGAPMAGVADAALASAISRAGGLGMIGVGSEDSPEFVRREAHRAREAGPFGIGLMVWALATRPELLEAALAAKPTLIALSFGDPTPYVDRCHEAGIRVAAQVHSREEARQAARAGVDLIVAQGTEAGGHTGTVATLPLLQIVLDTVTPIPAAAAGGIATPMGVAAVLAAGAVGAWVGTAFLVAAESRHSDAARARILAARETDTILTHVFDRIQRLDWPEPYAGRALRNAFAATWHGREDELAATPEARSSFERARGNYDIDYLYAGQAVGLVDHERSAAEMVRWLGDGAEAWLRRRSQALLAE